MQPRSDVFFRFSSGHFARYAIHAFEWVVERAYTRNFQFAVAQGVKRVRSEIAKEDHGFCRAAIEPDYENV
jgi:hypothetical protein